MRYCECCKVRIQGSHEHCPLCQRILTIHENVGESSCVESVEAFPYIPSIYKSNYIVFKIMSFISIALVIVSITLNLIISNKHWWSLFVVLGVVCFWIFFYVAFSKRKNIPKNILYQVVIISFFVFVWDHLTGWKGWSVDFVIPILCFMDLLVLLVLSKILHSDVDDYIIYMLIAGIFGIAPILFYLFGFLHYALPSIICIASSVLFLSGTVIFQGDKIKEELKRRLHY